MKQTLRVALLVLVTAAYASAQSADVIVGRLVNNAAIRSAQKFIDDDQAEILRQTADLETDRHSFSKLLKSEGIAGVDVADDGSVVGMFRGAERESLVAVGAHLSDSRALAAILATIRTLKKLGLEPAADLLIVGVADRHGSARLAAVDDFFTRDMYRGRLRSFVMIEGREFDRVSISPKTIGSNIVQLALEVISSFGAKPHYQEEMSDRQSAFDLKVPSITIGSGYLTPKGIQVAMTVVLAVAEIKTGVRQ